MTTASRIEMHDEIVGLMERNKDHFFDWGPSERTEMEEVFNLLVSLIDDLIPESIPRFTIY